jgi:hypothetical protein
MILELHARTIPVWVDSDSQDWQDHIKYVEMNEKLDKKINDKISKEEAE